MTDNRSIRGYGYGNGYVPGNSRAPPRCSALYALGHHGRDKHVRSRGSGACNHSLHGDRGRQRPCLCGIVWAFEGTSGRCLRCANGRTPQGVSSISSPSQGVQLSHAPCPSLSPLPNHPIPSISHFSCSPCLLRVKQKAKRVGGGHRDSEREGRVRKGIV